MYTNAPLSEWWWPPGIKPTPPHAVIIDRSAPMSVGLLQLLLFDNALLATGWHDYATPVNSFGYFGAPPLSLIASPFGGYSLTSTDGTGASGSFLNSPVAPTTAAWSASMLLEFNGTNSISGQSSPAFMTLDRSSAAGAAIDPLTGTWMDGITTANGKCGSSIATWTTWTRVHLTEDGTTFKVYINGRLDGSNAQAMTLSQATLFQGQTIPQADFFFWGRALDATQVAAHAA